MTINDVDINIYTFILPYLTNHECQAQENNKANLVYYRKTSTGKHFSINSTKCIWVELTYVVQ